MRPAAGRAGAAGALLRRRRRGARQRQIVYEHLAVGGGRRDEGVLARAHRHRRHARARRVRGRRGEHHLARLCREQVQRAARVGGDHEARRVLLGDERRDGERLHRRRQRGGEERRELLELALRVAPPLREPERVERRLRLADRVGQLGKFGAFARLWGARAESLATSASSEAMRDACARSSSETSGSAFAACRRARRSIACVVRSALRVVGDDFDSSSFTPNLCAAVSAFLMAARHLSHRRRQPGGVADVARRRVGLRLRGERGRRHRGGLRGALHARRKPRVARADEPWAARRRRCSCSASRCCGGAAGVVGGERRGARGAFLRHGARSLGDRARRVGTAAEEAARRRGGLRSLRQRPRRTIGGGWRRRRPAARADERARAERMMRKAAEGLAAAAARAPARSRTRACSQLRRASEGRRRVPTAAARRRRGTAPLELRARPSRSTPLRPSRSTPALPTMRSPPERAARPRPHVGAAPLSAVAARHRRLLDEGGGRRCRRRRGRRRSRCARWRRRRSRRRTPRRGESFTG